MRDLRLVGHEDGTVIFESLEGEKYRVLADEALRVSVRNAANAKPADLSITPRDIQDRIRSGETVQQIAETTGADVDFIEKFAQPVIYELEHIVQSALSIRITIAGDRFNDDTQEEFGRLIEARLAANGAAQVEWTSKRADGGVWLVSAHYEIKGHRGIALWAFEPRKFHLSPENESAVALSNHNSSLEHPIAKLRTVTEVIAPSVSTDSMSQVESGSTPAAFRKPEVATAETPAPAASTSGLLDELRKRRESSEAEGIVEDEILEPDFDEFLDEETEPRTGPLQVVPDLEDITGVVEELEMESSLDGTLGDDNQSQDTSPEPIHEEQIESHDAPANTKKGRATMPSWDEIVFGTKTDEDI
jgi:hypothetical protein